MNTILAKKAEKYLGIKESSVNNIAPAIQELQKSTWLAPGPWPWCASLVCQSLKDALEDKDFAAYIRSRYHGTEDLEAWRCKDASAFGWIKWASKLRPKHSDTIIFDERKPMLAGDIVVYDFSHIGIGRYDQNTANKIIAVIEGNTHPKSAVRDGTGDGVYSMNRMNTLVKNYIRL